MACFLTSNNSIPATLTSEYSLLPGILQAYNVKAADLPGYVAPVPEPAEVWLLGAGLLGVLGFAGKRKA